MALVGVVWQRRSWSRMLGVILMTPLVVLLGAGAGARAASAQPTVVLTPDCHDNAYPYGFKAGLAGFPPNQPFDVMLHYSGTDHSYTGILQTGPDGTFAPTSFGGDAPLGKVTVTVTSTINGAKQTFSASLNDPCDPPLTLSDAMCGDGNFHTYFFATESDCAAYVQRLQNGTARPSIALRATCAAGRYGFTGLALGVPRGTTLQAHVSFNGQVMDVGTGADRFGAVGPVGFNLASPPSQVSATLAGDGVSLMATLNDSCRTGPRFARAGSDPATGTPLVVHGFGLIPPSAETAKSSFCGTVRAHRATFGVTVTKGSTGCHTARVVLDDFLVGNGTMHGPPGGPAYMQWWAVHGWRCGYGTGGGGCSRASTRILAQQLNSSKVYVSIASGGPFLRVKPSTIHLLSNEDLSGLRWRSWGGRSAAGSGTHHGNSPSPGHPASNPVRVTATDLQQCGNHLVYTTITLRFTADVPYAGQPHLAKYAYGCPQ